jgi:hypothetical protein
LVARPAWGGLRGFQLLQSEAKEDSPPRRLS